MYLKEYAVGVCTKEAIYPHILINTIQQDQGAFNQSGLSLSTLHTRGEKSDTFFNTKTNSLTRIRTKIIPTLS